MFKFLFQVGALRFFFFCRLMLSSTSLIPVCSFIQTYEMLTEPLMKCWLNHLWNVDGTTYEMLTVPLIKCWLYQCRMSSSAPCMYVCNKDVLKNVKQQQQQNNNVVFGFPVKFTCLLSEVQITCSTKTYLIQMRKS